MDWKREQLIIDRLTSGHGQEFFHPGLERMNLALNSKFHQVRTWQEAGQLCIVTVAGTNGKGQTCYQLAKMAREQNLNVARWISPHILSIRERMSFNEIDISYEEWDEAYSLAKENPHSANLTYFEMLFLLFWEWLWPKLQSEEIDLIILEVGLGGRFDAVNVFDAQIAVLTSISRDHQAILGNSYAQILREKMGVLRPKQIVLSALELDYCRQRVQGQTTAWNCIWYDFFASHFLNKNDDYSLRNQTLAYFTLQFVLNFFNKNKKTFCIPHRQAFDSSLLAVRGEMKGRFERMTGEGQSFIFIGAHNLDGVRKLREFWWQEPKPQVLCAFSKRSDAEIKQCLELFCELGGGSDPVYLTEFDHPKAASVDQMRFDKKKVQFVRDWKYIIKQKKSSTNHRLWLVAGSFYFIGEVQQFLLSTGHYHFLSTTGAGPRELPIW